MPNRVGDNLSAGIARWSFGGTVSEDFDAHVSKSVPLYKQGHQLIVRVADFFLHEGSVCYDLGCSTGKLVLQLGKHNEGKRVRFIGVDAEKGMVSKAREICAELQNAEFVELDLREIDLEPADLIIAHYTMQFVLPRWRQTIFDKVYQALNWGGAFVLFEKVRSPDARFQDICNLLFTEFKIEQGYSASEIIAKAQSLKGVLEPFSTQANIDLLKRAGFVDITTIMKYVCFEGFLAIK